jgi:hypothetical protein
MRLGVADAFVGAQVDFLEVVIVRQSRSTNTLSRQQPLPSMLIAIPLVCSVAMTSGRVN